MKKVTIIALGTLLMSSSAAFANELATGPYVGASLSISKMDTQNGFPVDLSGGYIPLRAFMRYDQKLCID